MWLEHVGTNRALISTGWFDAARAGRSWRLPFAAIAAALWRRPGTGRLRLPPVSDAWLRQHEAECVKRQDSR